MSFAELQQSINTSWGSWKKRNKLMPVKRERKKHFCSECGKKGFQVKLDYIGNKHERHKVTVYDVSYWKCPRCNKIKREFNRIEGRGKLRANAGKMFGGV
jgi:rubrerythrin